MTNKLSDSSADKGFDLNHFNQDEGVETESFYASDDLFADTEQTQQPAKEDKTDPFDVSWNADQFAATGYEKKEPSISNATELETMSEAETASEPDADKLASDTGHDKQPATANETEQPVIAAQQPSMTAPPPPPDNSRSGTKSITVFAILAMLTAAIAVWLNPGAGNNSDESKQLAPRPVLAADTQMQRLQARMSSLEQQSSRQREQIDQQIDHLQQQISSLTNLLAKQVRQQQPIRHAATPTAKHKTARPQTSISPLSAAGAGWVVNLVSVDSQHAANKAQARYKVRGISAEIFRTRVKGKTWYRLRIGGFASKQEAIAQKNYLKTTHGIKDAWIQKP